MNNKKVSVRAQLFLESIPMAFIPGMFLLEQSDIIPRSYADAIPSLLLIGYFVLTVFLKKDINDELAEKILGKVNRICIEIIRGTLVVLLCAITDGIINDKLQLSKNSIGVILAFVIVSISVLRAILFCYFERKGDLN